MFSIILISFSWGALALRARRTFLTLDSSAAEGWGFTNLLWMSLSNFITLLRLPSNSLNLSRYSDTTSSCEVTTACNYCNFDEFSCTLRAYSLEAISG